MKKLIINLLIGLLVTSHIMAAAKLAKSLTESHQQNSHTGKPTSKEAWLKKHGLTETNHSSKPTPTPKAQTLSSQRSQQHSQKDASHSSHESHSSAKKKEMMAEKIKQEEEEKINYTESLKRTNNEIVTELQKQLKRLNVSRFR